MSISVVDAFRPPIGGPGSRCRPGEDFAAFYRSHYPTSVRLAYSLVGTIEGAEDVVQNCSPVSTFDSMSSKTLVRISGLASSTSATIRGGDVDSPLNGSYLRRRRRGQIPRSPLTFFIFYSG